jgi:outer membrane lipoprotein SlyB
MNYNQGLASTQYQNAFNNFNTQQNNIFNRLSAIASLGQNAAGNLGNSGTQLGTGIAQAQAGAAGSIAGGIVGATNSLGGAATNGLALNYLLNNGSGTDTSMFNYTSDSGGVGSQYAPAGGLVPIPEG